MALHTIDRAILGDFFHTPICGAFEYVKQALLLIDDNGNIGDIIHPTASDYKSHLARYEDEGKLTTLAQGQYLLPGLVDTHIHAPQWPQMGKALHVPLADWLQNHTFPLEAKYSDPEFAQTIYTSLVETLIANGTTSALYFGTVHLEATKILADICLEKGQRGYVGKVAMDNETECPDFYRDDTTQSGLDDTARFIDYVIGMKGNDHKLVRPVVTPRFLPSCTDGMLTGLGELVQKHQCHVQSHCSESDWVHGYGVERFGQSDTKTYRDFGLLTDKTILAHSNFMSEEDLDLLKEKDAGIAHCPLSNMYFSNAVFPAREALDKHVSVGLGTDIAAGPNPSILNSCINAVNVSRLREDGADGTVSSNERGTPNSRIDFMEAFWMATTGGGKALDSKVGLFKKGYAFDAILVNTTQPNSNLIIWPDQDTDEDIFQKIIYNADRHTIEKIWIQGRIVKDI